MQGLLRLFAPIRKIRGIKRADPAWVLSRRLQPAGIFWYHGGMNASPIRIGSRVSVELVNASGEAEQAAFTIVRSKQADLKSGLLDEAAPLGRALLGRHAGEAFPYTIGDLRQVRILSVENSEADISSEAARKRRQAVERAAAQSEITSQMIFSTASGSKWGDYEVNVDKLLDEQEPEE
jgi:hypothetical protein